MLFNSYSFIFGFLPIALLVFFLLSKNKTPVAQMVWLAVWSCVFYANWKFSYLFVLLASVLVNYTIAQSLMTKKNKRLFILGITFNISVIVYFKYKGFLLQNINAIMDVHFLIPKMALPLGISFITFQKIAYLVDVYSGRVKERNFLRYLVFISFFPQLIAGPIVHYNQLMSQFSRRLPKQLRYEHMAAGITLFIIGLVKKVVIADTLASYADPAFAASVTCAHLSFMEAWIGVLAYTFQIYFDFSGYSDMAIGLARMFGIRLPINFNSPYKSSSIIEFWRSWHMTLSQFLRDYVYIPLGGNRKGEIRKFINLMSTMLIGGLWHGSNWTFVIWGGIHGVLLTINHLWNELCDRFKWSYLKDNKAYRVLATGITFFCVVMAWVFFRIQNMSAVKSMFKSLFGFNGFILSQDSYLFQIDNRVAHLIHKITGISGNSISFTVSLLMMTMMMVWLFPNSQQIVRYRHRWQGSQWLSFMIWKPRMIYFVSLFALFYTAILFMHDFNFKPFQYFAF